MQQSAFVMPPVQQLNPWVLKSVPQHDWHVKKTLSKHLLFFSALYGHSLVGNLVGCTVGLLVGNAVVGAAEVGALVVGAFVVGLGVGLGVGAAEGAGDCGAQHTSLLNIEPQQIAPTEDTPVRQQDAQSLFVVKHIN